MATKVTLLTKNSGKLKAAKSVFEPYSIVLEATDFEFPEIQADSSLEIAKHTAISAAKALNKPVIREDHSLFLNALGAPGPYMNFFEKRISAEDLLKILSSFKDRTGYFEIATVYAEPSGFTKELVMRVNMYIKDTVVKDGEGWSGIMCLEGETRAFSEYPDEERLSVWNKNYQEIATFLSSRISRIQCRYL